MKKETRAEDCLHNLRTECSLEMKRIADAVNSGAKLISLWTEYIKADEITRIRTFSGTLGGTCFEIDMANGDSIMAEQTSCGDWKYTRTEIDDFLDDLDDEE